MRIGSRRASGRDRWRDRLAILLVWGVAAVGAAGSIGESFTRYLELRSGWSWDLAYYNQWAWSFAKGDRTLTVRPFASFGEEGPPSWKMNYLTPIRYLILPIYAIAPGPKLLLVIHGLIFWCVVPAAYGLARAEGNSRGAGIVGAGFTATTPLLWALAVNDFRELQLALPFAVWAYHGVRWRRVGLVWLGIAGLLACRQEFAILVASLAILPPARPEGIERRRRWSRALAWIGSGWFVIGYLGYLWLIMGGNAPGHYLGEFGGPRASFLEIGLTSGTFLVLGMAAWSIWMVLAPRSALLAIPWIYSLAAGRWAYCQLGSEQWHHVRYAAPMVATVLAAGCVGLGRGWRLGTRSRVGRIGLALLLIAAIGLQSLGLGMLREQFRAIPDTIEPDEARQLWAWIDRVGDEDGVLAHYEVTAPLSSRRFLWSYVLDANQPKGYPGRLEPVVRWVFLKRGDLPVSVLTSQGFERVHRGPRFEVYRRKAELANQTPRENRTADE